MGDKPRILIVDDHPLVGIWMGRVLAGQNEFWSCEFCLSSADAIKAFEKHPFDVIVADFRMPGIDGGTLLKIISERWQRAGRILISGLARHEISEAAHAYAHHFHQKPIDVAELISQIEECLKQAGR